MPSPAHQIRWNRSARGYRVVLPVLLAAIVFFTAGCQYGRRHSPSPDPSPLVGHLTTSLSSSPVAQTLVVYIFSKTDTEYENNMRFFLRWGVAADDGCDYVIIIQTMGEGSKVGASVQVRRRKLIGRLGQSRSVIAEQSVKCVLCAVLNASLCYVVHAYSSSPRLSMRFRIIRLASRACTP